MTDSKPTTWNFLLTRRHLFGLAGIGIVGNSMLTACSASTPGASPSTATSTTIDDPTIAAVADLVAARWPHGETIWPDHDYTKHAILALGTTDDGTISRAWLITTNGARQLASSEYSSLQVPPSFGQELFNQQQAISMTISSFQGELGKSLQDSSKPEGVDRDSDVLFRVATHELVHFYHQAELTTGTNASRDTHYPINVEPRVLRRMLLRRLHQALAEEPQRNTRLGQAAYWHDRWKKEYPQETEAILTFDIAEGAADYIERYMARFDPAAPTAATTLDAGLSDAKFFSHVDAESYELGFVTGRLLDHTRPDWKKGFYTSAKTMVETLLESVTAVTDVEDQDVRDGTAALITQTNDELAPAMKRVDDALADSSIAYLTYTGFFSSLSYSGSYVYQGRVVLLDAQFTLSTQQGELRVTAPVVFADHREAPYQVPLQPGSYSYQAGTLTATGKEVTGSASATLTQQDGRNIYTVTLVQ